MPNEKKSQFRAIRFARSAARGTSIIVPTLYGMSLPDSAMTVFAASTTRVRRRSNSPRAPTSGIMISGLGWSPSFIARAAASKIARTCIS